MKFIYLDAQGNQVGPVDEAIIERGIRDGSIPPGTAIRNAMLKEFRTVEEFDCFTAALAQAPATAASADPSAPGNGLVARLKRAARRDKVETSAYKAARTPQRAKLSRRLLSLFFDLLVLGVVWLVFYGMFGASGEVSGDAAAPAAAQTVKTTVKVDAKAEAPGSVEAGQTGKDAARRLLPALGRVEKMNTDRNAAVARETSGKAPAPKTAAKTVKDAAGKTADTVEEEVAERPQLHWRTVALEDGKLVKQLGDGRIYTVDVRAYHAATAKAFGWTFVVALLYYSLSLSIFAQTVGMWYWGILLTRSNLDEVYFLRAFIYVLVTVFFNVLMIPCVLFMKRSPADMICGVEQVRVCSAP